MKVVLDTNVLISGLAYPNSIPGRIVAAWDLHTLGLAYAVLPCALKLLAAAALYWLVLRPARGAAGA